MTQLRPLKLPTARVLTRPFLDDDGAGNYARGFLEVEVLVESDAESLPPASLHTFSRWPMKWLGAAAAAAGPATVTDCDNDDRSDHGNASFSLGNMEVGEKRGFRREDLEHASEGEGISCTLVDTATGERFPLGFAGALPDWQMGPSPKDAQRKRRGMVTEDSGGGADFCFGVGRRDASGGVAGTGGRVMEATMPTSRVTKKSVRLYRLELPGVVRAWSAEDPQLYTLVVSLTDEGGRSTQFESARVGFRSVGVASGQLLVNGRAVMLAGVNRHEHDPDTGKCVSEESMRQDVVMMKR